MQTEDTRVPHERFATGIAGLDRVLAGGLLRGGLHVFTGGPGTGKTVLASQIAYHAAARGEDVLYVSLMSESQARLIANLCTFPFFKHALVGTRVVYISGAAAFEHEEGLFELSRMLVREVRARRSKLVVVDSTGSLLERAGSGLAYRTFLRDFSQGAALSGCTVVLLVPEPMGELAIEQYVADAVLALYQPTVGMRLSRELSVSKLRGSDSLPGRHSFTIDARGVTVYPRRESLPRSASNARELPTGKEPSGIAGLDRMLEGGVPRGSMTAVMGAPGSGKTLIGLSFLAEALRRGERAVYLGFYETPDRLLDKASCVGLDLRAHVDGGALRMLWWQPAEQVLDEIAEVLLTEIETAGASRVFVDGLDGLLEGAFHAERFGRYFVALSNELRALGVTTFVTKEMSLSGERLGSAVPFSAAMDNIILVRYVALRSQLHRLISVLKMRESHYDASVHEFDITPEGCVVADTSASAEVLFAELAAYHGRLVEAARRECSEAPEGNAAPGGEP